jgi:hypothetical protein
VLPKHLLEFQSVSGRCTLLVVVKIDVDIPAALFPGPRIRRAHSVSVAALARVLRHGLNRSCEQRGTLPRPPRACALRSV